MIGLMSFFGAAVLSVGLLVALFPLMRRYALARPNARSSHTVPTPQGGGIAVVAATLVVSAGALSVADAGAAAWSSFAVLAAATVLLALLGAVDDIRPLPVWPRLALQALAVAATVAAASATGRALGAEVPLALEIALATVAGLWFVNLTNFMDGLDWLTVAAMVPIAATMAGLGVVGVVDPVETLVATALLGALVGFAPFNKPVARLFLGDVGSLPIGLLVAWLLYGLAAQGHWAAAVILPLYSCADATITLIARALRRERVWQAHRSHFYQRATDNGFAALDVSATIFVVSCLLAALAVFCVLVDGVLVDTLALALAAGLVAATLARFSRPREQARAAR